MHSVFIGLGSNLGEREDNILRALDILASEGSKPAALSPFYETAPQGFISEHAFINAAAQVLTPLTPEEFLASTQRVEHVLGRTHKSAGGTYHDRTIDIDILFYDNLIVETPLLAIPHPLIPERDFVLRPLCDIAPELVHPQSGLTVAAMLAALKNRR